MFPPYSWFQVAWVTFPETFTLWFSYHFPCVQKKPWIKSSSKIQSFVPCLPTRSTASSSWNFFLIVKWWISSPVFKIFGASAFAQSSPSIFSNLLPSSRRILILVFPLLGLICQLTPIESLVSVLKLCTQLPFSVRAFRKYQMRSLRGPSRVHLG